MTGALVAGVDSSTQSCKVLVCDAQTGAIVRQGRAAHPNGTEVDPAHWWSAFEEATAGGVLDGVRAIAVGGQQHGLVCLDSADEVVRPALLWNDTRSAGAAAELVAELGGPGAWAEATGVVPVAAITVAKLRWLADHEPGSMDRTRSVVLPHDWMTGQILKRGHGFRGWTTDRGDASGTGYYSAAEGDYRRDLLALAVGAPSAASVHLPAVLGPGAAAGSTSDGMLVAAGTGDNMAAALGLGLTAGDVVVSLGTSGTAFARHTDPCADPSGAVAGFADATGGFLPLVCTLNAARVLVAGAAMLGTDLAGLDALALRATVGAGGLTLLPYLDGERTPNRPEATGSLHGLTRANATPENLARAVVEGMVLGLSQAVDALAAMGLEPARVHLVGGAARSAAVRTVASTLFGVPVVVPDPGEYVALGAARQAAWARSGQPEPPSWAVRTSAVLDPVGGGAGAELRGRYAELVARTG